jgi:hypothetical protein
MFTVTEVLLTVGVKFHAYPKGPPATYTNQLIGTFKNLGQFREWDSNYKGWHRHHVVEVDDLQRLGVAINAPPYDDQLCVLLPERAHVGRINAILRRESPPSASSANACETVRAYSVRGPSPLRWRTSACRSWIWCIMAVTRSPRALSSPRV